MHPTVTQRPVCSLRLAAAAFQTARPSVALLQLLSTVPPLLALWGVMLWAASSGQPWVVAVLALPGAGFVVRSFILQHDCGHGSLFRTRATNDRVGRMLSVLTLTPYLLWRRQHAQHHAVWNNLDERDRGADIYSGCATLSEYLAMSRVRQLLYRATRHPLLSLVVVPPIVFLALYRTPFDTPVTWRSERRELHATNLALLLVHGGLGLLLGFGPVLLVLLCSIVPASIIGVWLFSVQHRFEGVVWQGKADWDPVTASLEGSSYLRLPRLLQWFTGNIGFHHIHHLAPKVPNHALEECHRSHPEFATGVHVIGLREGLAAWRHTLWDEAQERMVGFPNSRQSRLR